MFLYIETVSATKVFPETEGGCMRFSSLSGADRGVGRNGRWFVLVFLCVALIMVLAPAASLGYTVTPKVTLTASASNIIAGSAVTLKATATNCPSGATFTLQATDANGTSTVGTSAAKNSSASFTVAPGIDTSYVAVLTWSKGTAQSKAVNITIKVPVVTLKGSTDTILATGSVSLTASATNCPAAGATFTLKAVTSRGTTTVSTVAAVVKNGKGTATFKVKPTRDIGYIVILRWNGAPITSDEFDIEVVANLTLTITPGMYAGTCTISGTMIPAWAGGSVSVKIWKMDRCGHLSRPVVLSVPLRASSGDMSTYTTDWSGKAHTRYLFQASVDDGPYFLGNTSRKIWVQL
jgi:hypothetical protein